MQWSVPVFYKVAINKGFNFFGWGNLSRCLTKFVSFYFLIVSLSFVSLTSWPFAPFKKTVKKTNTCRNSFFSPHRLLSFLLASRPAKKHAFAFVPVVWLLTDCAWTSVRPVARCVRGVLLFQRKASRGSSFFVVLSLFCCHPNDVPSHRRVKYVKEGRSRRTSKGGASPWLCNLSWEKTQDRTNSALGMNVNVFVVLSEKLGERRSRGGAYNRHLQAFFCCSSMKKGEMSTITQPESGATQYLYQK